MHQLITKYASLKSEYAWYCDFFLLWKQKEISEVVRRVLTGK